MNYFELFGLPEKIITDSVLLNKRYVELQKKYHPDFFTKEDAASQEEALEKSSEVNKAMKVLKNPDACLFYILQQRGLSETEEKYPLPPDFLMEVMELNENLSADSAAAVEAFEKTIYESVSSIINNYDANSITAPELMRLKDYYYKKKYLRRILDRLEG